MRAQNYGGTCEMYGLGARAGRAVRAAHFRRARLPAFATIAKKKGNCAPLLRTCKRVAFNLRFSSPKAALGCGGRVRAIYSRLDTRSLGVWRCYIPPAPSCAAVGVYVCGCTYITRISARCTCTCTGVCMRALETTAPNRSARLDCIFFARGARLAIRLGAVLLED